MRQDLNIFALKWGTIKTTSVVILTNLQQKLLQTVKKIRTNRKIRGIVFTFSYNHYTAFLVWCKFLFS